MIPNTITTTTCIFTIMITITFYIFNNNYDCSTQGVSNTQRIQQSYMFTIASNKH